MGHSLYYYLSRATALEPAELERLALHVGKWKPKVKDYQLHVPPEPGRTGVVAFGDVRTSYTSVSLLEAVTELRGLLPDASLSVTDDLQVTLWNGKHYTYGTGTADADVGFPHDHVEWPVIEPIKPPRKPSGKKAMAAVTDAEIDAQIDGVVESFTTKARNALERNLPARIAMRGFARWAQFRASSTACDLIARALTVAGDEIPDDILAAASRTAIVDADWRSKHDCALRPVVDRAVVFDVMLDALDSGSRSNQVEMAVTCLVASRDPTRVVAHLLRRLRIDRGRHSPWRDTVLGAIGKLARASPRPEVLPTLLLELASDAERSSASAREALTRTKLELDERWRVRVLGPPGATKPPRLVLTDDERGELEALERATEVR